MRALWVLPLIGFLTLTGCDEKVDYFLIQRMWEKSLEVLELPKTSFPNIHLLRQGHKGYKIRYEKDTGSLLNRLGLRFPREIILSVDTREEAEAKFRDWQKMVEGYPEYRNPQLIETNIYGLYDGATKEITMYLTEGVEEQMIYSLIAHELLHAAMSLKGIPPVDHHCRMVSDGYLRHVSGLLNNQPVTNKILELTAAQCEGDKIREPEFRIIRCEFFSDP